MIFNVALVLAACITALIMPPDGRSVPVLLVLAAGYAVLGVAFLLVTRGMDLNSGTESMRSVIAEGEAGRGRGRDHPGAGPARLIRPYRQRDQRDRFSLGSCGCADSGRPSPCWR